jgi:hypothetical protein
MPKLSIRFVAIIAALTYSGTCVQSDSLANDSEQDGKLLTCFVYSLQTIPLLQKLQLHIKQDASQVETQELIRAVGGEGKIQLALFDAEIVLASMSKLVSEKHIIKLDERLFDNPMWILSNELYYHSMKEKDYKEQFLETFRFTQSCIDDFLQTSSKKR